MNKSQILAVLAFAALSFSAFAQDPDCAGSHFEQMQCQGKRLKSLDDELNRVYQLALDAMPAKNALDIRKGREQLRRSQRAWLTYFHEDCTLIGGLRGGSDSWVTTFASDCEEKALADRIAFLQAIADGKFGG
jgi:uncharacterized protein YecT (DUF1311 family)